ncbi:MAG: penicillin-binding protein activator [Deltaproteobacteria bacterium]|nr:penicillin-binding protein activator [Candidatus Anaeroferrophillus wilburensis]MBN2889105.1 penicillin-binding protein activator [Deltaproteobacteria bacterium]
MGQHLRQITSPILVIIILFSWLPGCVRAPVRHSLPQPPAQRIPTVDEPAWERQARQLEFEGQYLAAYLQIHDPYFRSLRPDLHRWLVRLLDAMSLEDLERVRVQEQSNELRCQVLAVLSDRLQTMEPEDARVVPIIMEILTHCTLPAAKRHSYEQLLQRLSQEKREKPLVVGCLLPLSGEYASYGQKVLRGMELALEVFHHGEEYGTFPPLKLLVRDTAGEGEQARSLVQELDDEGVSLLLGPVTGKAALYAAIEADSRSIPIITLTPRSGVAGRGDYVFQHFLTMRNQAEQLLDLAVGRLGITSLVVLYPATLFGREFAEVFETLSEQWGADLVRVVSYDPASDDYSRSIKTLIGEQRYAEYQRKKDEYEAWLEAKKQQENAAEVAEEKNSLLTLAQEIGLTEEGLFAKEVELAAFMPRPILELDFAGIVIPDFYQRVRLLAPQLAFYDLTDCRLFGTRGWNSPQLADDAGNQVEGALFVDAYCDDCVEPPQLADYRQRYGDMFMEPASVYDAYGFDTIVLVNTILAGREQHQVAPDSAWLVEALKNFQDVPMVTGITSVLPDGEVAKKLQTLTFQRGAIVAEDAICREGWD